MTNLKVKATALVSHDLSGSHYALRLAAGTDNIYLYEELERYGDMALFEKELADIGHVASLLLDSDPNRQGDRFQALTNSILNDPEIPAKITIKDLMTRMYSLKTQRTLTHAAHRAVGKLVAQRLMKLAHAVADCQTEGAHDIPLT